MPNWLNVGGAKPKVEDGAIEITPESLKKSMEDNKTELEQRLSDLGNSINEHPTLKAMQEYLDSQKAAQEAAVQRAQQQQQQQTSQRFENVDQTTREYVDQTLRPIAQATLLQQGTELRRSIFDDAEAFPYYTGSIKSKVDALLDSQPAESRANPDIIRNVYKIVVFDNQKEIAEDKHKSRLSSASASGTGTGNSGGADKNAMPVLTQQMRQVAKSMGISEADYATAMKELQETGEYA